MYKKYLISIEHPAWIHQFKHIINSLIEDGNDVTILAINKDRSFELLDSFGFNYIRVANSTGNNIIEKGILFFWLCLLYSFYTYKYKTEVLIGRASPMMAVAAFLNRKKHIIFEDTEVSHFSLNICKLFSAKILTSTSFLNNLGKKQLKTNCYKELFYLHPKYFQPDKNILIKHGFNPNEKYVIVRFISWNASHDINCKGLNNKEQINFIKRLNEYYKVYITSEKPLCNELKQYLLDTPYELIHHILSFAQIYIGEGATMASESAVLGTYAIYINDLISGSTKELEEKYELMSCFQKNELKYELAIKKVKELTLIENLKEETIKKRDIMLSNKIDINEYYLKILLRGVGNVI